MLKIIKNNKILNIFINILIASIVLFIGIPLFQILVEIIVNLGRIFGTFIRIVIDIC